MTARRTAEAAHPLATQAVLAETFSLDEAARYLRLGRDATRELWETGELAGVSLNQKHLVFRRKALDEFLERMERKQQRALAARAGAVDRAVPAPAAGRRRRRGQLPDLTRYEQGK